MLASVDCRLESVVVRNSYSRGTDSTTTAGLLVCAIQEFRHGVFSQGVGDAVERCLNSRGFFSDGRNSEHDQLIVIASFHLGNGNIESIPQPVKYALDYLSLVLEAP
jgi:hypothetical protein